MADDLKIMGKKAQLLPRYIRVVCRSRIDYTPDEILDYMHRQTLTNLLKWDKLEKYGFAQHHALVLRKYDTKGLLDIIHSLRGSKDIKNERCPFQVTGAKFSCFSCGMVKDCMEVLKKDETVQPSNTPREPKPENQENPVKAIVEAKRKRLQIREEKE